MKKRITFETLKSYEDVVETPGFVEGLPFKKEDYLSVVGDYLINERLKCCILREGHKCNTPHIHGYLVRLKDKSVTIVGNDCVDRLDNSEKIIKGIRIYNQQKELSERLKVIEDRIGDDFVSSEKLSKTRDSLKDIRKYCKDFLGILTPIVRTRFDEVVISRRGVIYAVICNYKGGLEDRRTVSVCQLDGYEIFNSPMLDTLIQKMSSSLGYHARYLNNKNKLNEREVNKIYTGVKSDKWLIEQGEDFADKFYRFKNNDLRFLSMLTYERGEQLDYLRGLSSFAGKKSPDPHADLKAITTSIIEKYGAEAVEAY